MSRPVYWHRGTHGVPGKFTLFRAYCTNFYMCSLWANYTQNVYSALRVQYDNIFMVLLMQHFCSAPGMFGEAENDCFYATACKRCASLVYWICPTVYCPWSHLEWNVNILAITALSHEACK